jgi:hypothetical protein
MAPSKFCALSSNTAVFAFWRALESMAFCEGCFELLLEELLPFVAWERCLEWPLERGLSSSTGWRCSTKLSNLPPDPDTGDGPKFVGLVADGDLFCEKSLGPSEESSQARPK